jgi:flagella basal body P-ring formation protein FlgA
MIPLAAFAVAAACLPIEAPQDRITAADLARALPEWSVIAPETPVLLAPVPNVVRVLHPAELRSLAARFHVAGEPAASLCFQRPVAAVLPDRMLAVMHARLPGATIEILEPSRMPAPAGELDFPLTGLRPGYWFGHVTYGTNHKFVVWARVDVKAPIQHIVASADLKPGEPIDPVQLRIETREEFPSAGALADAAANIADFAGRVTRRPIKAGTVVRKEWLDAPKLVERGETVKVEVISGAARLEAQGIAESSGARGDIISVQNPESKRRFRARVESQGRVSVKGGV